MVSLRLQKQLDEYALSHSNKVNLAIHKVAIPLIIFHIFAMLSWVPLFSLSFYTVTLAELVTLAVFIYYLFLNVKYAFIMFFLVALCIFIAHHTAVWLVWVITIITWTIQLLGHAVWEKKAPAFTKNFLQLLIGPLFILNRIIK